MAKTLVSFRSNFLAVLLPPLPRGGRFRFPLYRPRKMGTRVRMSFQDIPPIHDADSLAHLHGIVSRVESLLYTIADATAPATDASTAVQKNGGWLGFISDAMEVVLKVLKDVLTAIHVPYAYGLAIILLTVIVKVLTFPLTKQQVNNCTPAEIIQLETSRLYRQAGVNPLAGCFPTLATIPVWIGDGHPPLGWSDTAAYLVLPVLLVISQYVSMEIMKPPQVCGAKPAVSGDAGGIISAGRAKRTASQPAQTGERLSFQLIRLKQLKEEENRKMFNKALAVEGQTSASTSISDDESDGESNDKVCRYSYASFSL
ncbi:hypothetical protein B296_00036126 [Ensete ventricosum]|uniref:Uncharacterized protein n=1 Tax=Ensete ventricosum TaxID=4639 RepID=A0A427A3S6_ENSVE|nr:hypothetical protein B296_00036126 [Ensete ventricosum]